jgi:hypothetical protein
MDNALSPLKAFKRSASPDWAIEQLRLVLDLTDEEVARLEKPYIPRYDLQRISPILRSSRGFRLASGSSPQQLRVTAQS